jgi:glutathione S-transferase
MKLYSGPLSLFSRKVEIALREKGIAFEREMVPFSQARGYQPKHPAVIAANPKQQVPVLVDGDLVLFDSTLIFEYLEDAYPEPPLFPESAPERARCRMFDLTADEILLPLIRPFMHRSEPPNPDPERRRAQEAAAEEAELALLRHYDKLQAELGRRDFFCGRPSYADIALFMSILFIQRLKGPRLDGHPGLLAWYGRLLARPAFGGVAGEIAAADRELSPALQS